MEKHVDSQEYKGQMDIAAKVRIAAELLQSENHLFHFCFDYSDWATGKKGLKTLIEHWRIAEKRKLAAECNSVQLNLQMINKIAGTYCLILLAWHNGIVIWGSSRHF